MDDSSIWNKPVVRSLFCVSLYENNAEQRKLPFFKCMQIEQNGFSQIEVDPYM